MDLKKRKLDDHGDDSVSIAPDPAPPPPVDNPPSPSHVSADIARLIIDPLPKEQLLDIVVQATLRHPDILDEVRKFADRDPVHRKIFVRGLGWETNTDSLKGVFSQFGELEEGVVIMDKNTGKSRGYGFVTFRHMDGALKALKEPSKRIDGRMTVSQLASLGPAPAPAPQDIAARKIYVGNVSMDWPADRLLNLFAQYGEIEEGPLGFDKQTGRSRGFALFIYRTAEAANSALEEPVKLVDGHQLFCKLAVDGLKQKAAAVQGQPDVPMVQTGSGLPPPSNMQYGAAPQGMVTTGAPYGQNANLQMNPGMNPGLSPAMNRSMYPALAGPTQNLPQSLNTSLPSPMNPSHTQLMNPGVSQVQSSLGVPSYGSTAGMNPYGSQVSAYGGQPGVVYPGIGASAPMYNVPAGSMPSQTPAFQSQGQYAMAPYQSQQQVAVPSAPRPQQTGSVPSLPYYGM